MATYRWEYMLLVVRSLLQGGDVQQQRSDPKWEDSLLVLCLAVFDCGLLLGCYKLIVKHNDRPKGLQTTYTRLHYGSSSQLRDHHPSPSPSAASPSS